MKNTRTAHAKPTAGADSVRKHYTLMRRNAEWVAETAKAKRVSESLVVDYAIDCLRLNPKVEVDFSN